ncbi:MAG: NAD(P)H-hydrate dehydratase, partial [Acidimicrobiia bacterium]
LKGPTTVVAHPDGRVRLSTSGDARLATAGTGDVLSGIVGALLCQGIDAFDAAAAGAWLHGRAAARGPARGLVASDVVEGLPAALGELGEVGR